MPPQRRRLRSPAVSPAARVATGFVATTSEMASRPPGLSTRNASRKTWAFSGERLMTQFGNNQVDRRISDAAGTRLGRRGSRAAPPLAELFRSRSRETGGSVVLFRKGAIALANSL